MLFSSSTPGYSNTLTSVSENDNLETELVVYPNPVQDGIVYFNKEIDMKLFDITGKLRIERRNISYLKVDKFTPGLYILKTDEGETAKIIIQ